MAIPLRCRCANTFDVSEKLAGNTTMCPECGTFLDVPEPGKRSTAIAERDTDDDIEEEEEELSPRELKRLVRDAIEEDIRPVRRTAGYHFAVACAAVAMLVLPALYIGLIILVAFLVYWHATSNLDLFRTVRIYWAVVLYVGPLIAGVVLIGFMLKPLLARPPRDFRGRLVRIDQEPVLAEFVDNIARAVHAPKPKRIEVDCLVNASASFGQGLFALFGHNLTLTIGLPLIEGLSGRQLAGILAHEFGHFSQGAGMRLSYVVRSVNAWFARVVYERDAWDEELREWSEGSGAASFIAVIVRLCVGTTRGILWVFMVIGHGLSCFLLRRMEYDADRSEARLVGVRTFEKTSRRMALLDAAAVEADEIVEGCYSNDRYPDDYAALVVGLADSMSNRDVRKVQEEMEDANTGIFDTHPSFADRLASVEREDPRGVFDLDLPASALFRKLSKLSSAASLDLYKAMFGRGIRPTLRPVEEFLSR